MKSFKFTLGALLVGTAVWGISGNATVGKTVFETATAVDGFYGNDFLIFMELKIRYYI